jgi:hypothetical protein
MQGIKTIKVEDRLAKVQNALYEKAHSEPCELKFLAIKLGKQGIDGEKLYGNLQMLGLPFGNCKYLDSLTARQRTIISALNYAYLYKIVARSEVVALSANMDTADRVFTQYSEDWMVLYQETQEEMDHIWTFRHIFNSTLSQVGAKESLNDPGFFGGEDIPPTSEERSRMRALKEGPIEWWSIWSDRSWEHRMLYHIFYNMKNIPEHEIPGTALGALYLLHRYLGNVHLKQMESYFFHNPDRWNYEPLAMDITKGHFTDEARHYTTSFDLGMELFRAADSSSQTMVKFFLKNLIEGHIGSFYLTFGEMVEMGEHGVMSTPYLLGLNALRMAMRHPEFTDSQADIPVLTRDWHDRKIGMEPGGLQKMRWRYVSQQLERIIDVLEIKLDPDAISGNGYNRYQESLNYAAA